MKRKKMNVEEVAKLLIKTPQYIRLGLQQNKFPFGTAIQKKNNRWTYLIIESKVYEYANLNKERTRG